MDDYFEHILRRIRSAEGWGSRTLSTGVNLIGHVPHVAPEAYHHVVFPGLSAGQITDLEDQLGRSLPVALRDFYRMANGLLLFNYSLSVLGLRSTRNYRSGDRAWQPHSFVQANTIERPLGASHDLVFFASYDWDGSLLAASPATPEITRYVREGAKPINRWKSLDVMFADEMARLDGLFDDRGRKYDNDQPTTPISPTESGSQQ